MTGFAYLEPVPATLLPLLRHHLPALRSGIGRHLRSLPTASTTTLVPLLAPVPVRPAVTNSFPFSR